MTSNVFVYRLSRGRLGSRMGGQSVLLLNTVGRKSGRSHTTPTNYYLDQGRYVIVASNWGGAHHPAWYYNLIHQPAATVQVKEKIIKVTARLAEDKEYDRLWCFVTHANAFYRRYQQKTTRNIPLIILTPQE